VCGGARQELKPGHHEKLKLCMSRPGLLSNILFFSITTDIPICGDQIEVEISVQEEKALGTTLYLKNNQTRDVEQVLSCPPDW
jgi:hypothetical protein